MRCRCPHPARWPFFAETPFGPSPRYPRDNAACAGFARTPPRDGFRTRRPMRPAPDRLGLAHRQEQRVTLADQRFRTVASR